MGNLSNHDSTRRKITPLHGEMLGCITLHKNIAKNDQSYPEHSFSMRQSEISAVLVQPQSQNFRKTILALQDFFHKFQGVGSILS